MNERAKLMERAKDFRVARERASEMALASANAFLREAERSLGSAREAEEMAAAEAIQALEEGNAERGRSAMAMSASLRKAFGLDREYHERARTQKVEDARQAEEELRVRRIESEQAVTLHKHAQQTLTEQAAKKEQAQMVERYLARSRWSSAKVRVKSLTEPASI